MMNGHSELRGNTVSNGKLMCLHEYEVYGSKCPSKIKIRGKEQIGTVDYLECNKCGKCKTHFSKVLQGEWI